MKMELGIEIKFVFRMEIMLMWADDNRKTYGNRMCKSL